eukprot:Nk52_evm44s296 gene=Nk52_evmTU44s296
MPGFMGMDAQQVVALEAVNQLSPENVDKYRKAADIANTAMHTIVTHCVAGSNVYALCSNSDALMEQLLKKVYKAKKLNPESGEMESVDKGIAFPTCISINNCAGYYSPMSSDQGLFLSVGDVVKIELGVHIDGFIATSAHTQVVNPDVRCPAIGRVADVICATYMASEAALHLVRPGVSSKAIPEVIEKFAKAYNCSVIGDRYSRQMRRFAIEGSQNVIPGVENKDDPTEEFFFEEGQVYSIDIALSTGSGKPTEMGVKNSVFKRDVNNSYSLKVKASRALMNTINEKSPVMPFTLREMGQEGKVRLGMTEIMKHDLVRAYPVLFEKPGQFVAHFKYTVIILPGESGTLRITSCPPPHCSSEYSLCEEEINRIRAMSDGKVKTAPVHIMNIEEPATKTSKKNSSKSSAMEM